MENKKDFKEQNSIKSEKDSSNAENNSKSKKAEEKEKQKIEKKLNKKVAKAVGIILNHENKKAEEIFTDEPSLNMFFYHFGNGDEDDQIKTKNYFEKNYGNDVNVIIYPGISYGFIELKSIETAENIIKNQSNFNLGKNLQDFETLNEEEIHNENLKKFVQKKKEEKNSNEILVVKYDKKKKGNPHSSTKMKIFYHDLLFDNGERTIFTIFSKITSEEVKQKELCNVPNASLVTEIPGLLLLNDFITEKEEENLLNEIDANKWEKLTNRKVQHYGYEFIYGANVINKNKKIGELPNFCDDLKIKFEKLLSNFKEQKFENTEEIKEQVFYKYDNENKEKENNEEQINKKDFYAKFGNFDQLTINNYTPGDGIPPHWDTHSPFEDVFCSLSLGSGVTMSFSYKNEQRHLYIKPRSLLIFSEEARYLWEHSISLRKIDRVEDNVFFRKRRVSLTFRKIRKGECNCIYTNYCDSQMKKLGSTLPLSDFNLNMNNKSTNPIAIEEAKNLINNESTVPTNIEKKHVYDVYEKIAPHFSHTRYRPWPKVADFLNDIPKGSFMADIGCGNGKYLNVKDKEVFNIGTDRCMNLLAICREKNEQNQVFQADSLKLPFRSNCFERAISIAVVHHFSNDSLRLKAIKEIIRILTIGGKFLIYVWAMEQEKNFKQQDNFVPWHLQKNYENDLHVETLGPEIIKEEKKNSTVYHRYYHMFRKDELENLIKEFDNIEIEESYYDHENWCCIVKKIK